MALRLVVLLVPNRNPDITVTEPSFSPPDVVWEPATRSPCGFLRWPHSVGGAECGRCKKPYGKRAPGARTTSSACSDGHRRHRRRCVGARRSALRALWNVTESAITGEPLVYSTIRDAPSAPLAMRWPTVTVKYRYNRTQ